MRNVFLSFCSPFKEYRFLSKAREEIKNSKRCAVIKIENPSVGTWLGGPLLFSESVMMGTAYLRISCTQDRTTIVRCANSSHTLTKHLKVQQSQRLSWKHIARIRTSHRITFTFTSTSTSLQRYFSLAYSFHKEHSTKNRSSRLPCANLITITNERTYDDASQSQV